MKKRIFGFCICVILSLSLITCGAYALEYRDYSEKIDQNGIFGDYTIYVNDKAVAFDSGCEPFTYEGVLYVSFGEFFEALGAETGYNHTSETGSDFDSDSSEPIIAASVKLGGTKLVYIVNTSYYYYETDEAGGEAAETKKEWKSDDLLTAKMYEGRLYIPLRESLKVLDESISLHWDYETGSAYVTTADYTPKTAVAEIEALKEVPLYVDETPLFGGETPLNYITDEGVLMVSFTDLFEALGAETTLTEGSVNDACDPCPYSAARAELRNKYYDLYYWKNRLEVTVYSHDYTVTEDFSCVSEYKGEKIFVPLRQILNAFDENISIAYNPETKETDVITPSYPDGFTYEYNFSD